LHNDIRIIPVKGIGDIHPGTDLGLLISNALQEQDLTLQTGDIVVITQKIVSKTEGQVLKLDEVEPSDLARTFAAASDKDPRQVEAVLRESRRIVRMDRGVLLTETKQGFICANSGIDESNVKGTGEVTLLPVDSDRSARDIRARLQELNGTNMECAVLITDTWGRVWRNGQVNFAIGCAGLEPLVDYRGQIDSYGYELHASIIAVADELASAAELVMGKIDRVPVAIIRGYTYQPGDSSAQALIRDSAQDMFR
jgi:coenzyme F420-0:L-glutamate ligase/coenzyme F420-1:gamma-L-glutamate ligase